VFKSGHYSECRSTQYRYAEFPSSIVTLKSIILSILILNVIILVVAMPQ
jgi:hypothetical protein